MNKIQSKRSSFIRVRISPIERKIIDLINKEHDFTNVSEHVRRTLNFYANNVYPNVITQTKEGLNEK